MVSLFVLVGPRVRLVAALPDILGSAPGAPLISLPWMRITVFTAPQAALLKNVAGGRNLCEKNCICDLRGALKKNRDMELARGGRHKPL